MDQLMPGPAGSGSLMVTPWPCPCGGGRVGDGHGVTNGRAARNRTGVGRLRDGEGRVLTTMVRWPTRRGRWWRRPWPCQVGADRGDGGRTRDVHEVTGPGPWSRCCRRAPGADRPADGAAAGPGVGGLMDQLMPDRRAAGR